MLPVITRIKSVEIDDDFIMLCKASLVTRSHESYDIIHAWCWRFTDGDDVYLYNVYQKKMKQ